MRFKILPQTKAQSNLKIFLVHWDLRWLAWYHMKYKTMQSLCSLQLIILSSVLNWEILEAGVAYIPEEENCHSAAEGAAESPEIRMRGMWQGRGSTGHLSLGSP